MPEPKLYVALVYIRTWAAGQRREQDHDGSVVLCLPDHCQAAPTQGCRSESRGPRGRVSITDIQWGAPPGRAIPQSWPAPRTGRAGWCRASCIPWRRSPCRAGGFPPWWKLRCSAGQGSPSQWFWWHLKGWPWNSTCSIRTHWSPHFGRSPGFTERVGGSGAGQRS